MSVLFWVIRLVVVRLFLWCCLVLFFGCRLSNVLCLMLVEVRVVYMVSVLKYWIVFRFELLVKVVLLWLGFVCVVIDEFCRCDWFLLVKWKNGSGKLFLLFGWNKVLLFVEVVFNVDLSDVFWWVCVIFFCVFVVFCVCVWLRVFWSVVVFLVWWECFFFCICVWNDVVCFWSFFYFVFELGVCLGIIFFWEGICFWDLGVR